MQQQTEPESVPGIPIPVNTTEIRILEQIARAARHNAFRSMCFTSAYSSKHRFQMKRRLGTK